MRQAVPREVPRRVLSTSPFVKRFHPKGVRAGERYRHICARSALAKFRVQGRRPSGVPKPRCHKQVSPVEAGLSQCLFQPDEVTSCHKHCCSLNSFRPLPDVQISVQPLQPAKDSAGQVAACEVATNSSPQARVVEPPVCPGIGRSRCIAGQDAVQVAECDIEISGVLKLEMLRDNLIAVAYGIEVGFPRLPHAELSYGAARIGLDDHPRRSLRVLRRPVDGPCPTRALPRRRSKVDRFIEPGEVEGHPRDTAGSTPNEAVQIGTSRSRTQTLPRRTFQERRTSPPASSVHQAY